MKRIFLSIAVALLATATAHAGPIRSAVAHWRANHTGAVCGTCGGQPAATTAPPVQYQQGSNAVYQTSYSGIGVPVDATQYTPIRMGGVVLPTTCGPNGCGK